MTVFKFKRFDIIQKKSAMKVGTDGVLLGSWATCDKASMILDVGCGTGLLALMLAQRNKSTNIVGLEIDKLTSGEAQLNFDNSDWRLRLKVYNIALQDFNTTAKFDLIVSNPPFFPANNSKKIRDIARRTNTLSFDQLLFHSSILLNKRGILSVIIPKDAEESFCKKAKEYNLYCHRTCNVQGNQFSHIKRVMIEFTFYSTFVTREHLIIEKSRHNYTKDYIKLCKAFYLDF